MNVQLVVPAIHTVIKTKCDLQTVRVINDNLTHMFKALPFDIFRVRTLHTINVTVLVLFKNKPFTNEGNENTIFMTNSCMKKNVQTCLTLLHPEYCISDNPGHGTT